METWGIDGKRIEVQVSNCALLAGDLCVTKHSLDDFERGNLSQCFGGQLAEEMQQSLGVVLNLEGPITDREAPIVKSGPCLRMPTSVMAIIDRMPLLAVGLANNHILDHGAGGLEDTISVLNGRGIRHLGAGNNLAEAAEWAVIEVAKRRIGLYCCAEHEFTIAGTDTPGANPFDDLEIKDTMRVLKAQSDYVVVLYHGLKEYYRYPTPRVRARCRAMADAGADLVLCQHSHCVGSAEEYSGATILYGQGNFHFARGHADEYEGSGLLVALCLDGGGVGFVPLANDGRRVWLATGREAESIMGPFLERSSRLGDDEFLAREYARFCESLSVPYLRAVRRACLPAPLRRLCRALERAGVARSFSRDPRDRATLLNLIRCEAHNEALSTHLANGLR